MEYWDRVTLIRSRLRVRSPSFDYYLFLPCLKLTLTHIKHTYTMLKTTKVSFCHQNQPSFMMPGRMSSQNAINVFFVIIDDEKLTRTRGDSRKCEFIQSLTFSHMTVSYKMTHPPMEMASPLCGECCWLNALPIALCLISLGLESGAHADQGNNCKSWDFCDAAAIAAHRNLIDSTKHHLEI